MTTRRGIRVVAVESAGRFGFLDLERLTIEGPGGERADRVVLRHPGAVAIVPIIEDDIILIEQYRTPVDDVVLEVPAGKLDPGDDDLLDTARRELREETGYDAVRFTALTSMLTTVGFTDEVIHLFMAEGLVPGELDPDGVEEEVARIVRMPFIDAVAAVLDGRITDGKSIAGILIAHAIRNRGAEES
ncbi:MAG: NUDIX hydrolase [Acidimicrobiia bacterium]|nr:NUDIX hydrolase [Acidimicrobiia bacterium]